MEPRPVRRSSRTDMLKAWADNLLERQRDLIDSDAPMTSVTLIARIGPTRVETEVFRTEAQGKAPTPFPRREL